MTGGVVYQLELIQIEIAEGVPGAMLLGADAHGHGDAVGVHISVIRPVQSP